MPDLPPPCPHERPRRPDRRPSAARRGYGYAWQKIRLIVLAREPLCRECGTGATDVHHIDGNPTNNQLENLCPLCHACHSRTTAREHR